MDTRTGRIRHMTQSDIEAACEHDRCYLMPIEPTAKQERIMKVGRNEPCPCGSGKKFKKCHLGKEVGDC